MGLLRLQLFPTNLLFSHIKIAAYRNMLLSPVNRAMRILDRSCFRKFSSSSFPKTAEYNDMFLPPVNRAMQTLDRSFFRKTIPLAALDIFEAKNIPRVRRECARDLLDLSRIKQSMVTADERTLVLLRPNINANNPESYSDQLRSFRDQRWLRVRPFNLKLEYDYWTYEEILGAILPESIGIPSRSYQPVGHIGNLLLKPEFHPHKSIIAQVFLTKTPQLKTIVVKPLPGPTDHKVPLGPMEHLAGDVDTNVKVRATGCDLKFDFALTDYDQRLTHSTKELLAEIIGKRGAIAEVCAGLSTLALQAAKKKNLVYVNNPNPHNHTTFISNIPQIPPIPDFIQTFNLPARDFVRTAITTLLARSQDDLTKLVALPLPHNDKSKPRPAPMMMRLPAVFNHFVIPHSVGGLAFLSVFRDVYAGLEIDNRIMPTIHVYTYHARKQPALAHPDILTEICEQLNYQFAKEDIKVEVAVEGTGATLFRVSFQLPREVALGKKLKMKQPITENVGEKYGHKLEKKIASKKIAMRNPKKLRKKKYGGHARNEGKKPS